MFFIPVKKMWYLCPFCGKKVVLFDDTASCRGIYVKCRRCGRTLEIRILQNALTKN